MVFKRRGTHYSLLAKSLHWLTAVLVIGLFALGLWMDGLSYSHPWYHKAPSLHMSFGIVLFLIVMIRIGYRAFTHYPEPLQSHKTWERVSAAWAHGVLYLCLLGMIVSGYLIATAEGDGIMVFDIFELPALFENIESLEDIVAEIHELLAFFIIGVATIHGAAALKHHFLDKDSTLKRMLPGSK